MEAEGSIADPNDRSKMRFSYVNDQTLMPIANRKQGQNISKMLNDARIALRNGDEVKAQLKLAPTGIPYDRFKTWFQETVSSDGVKKPASFTEYMIGSCRPLSGSRSLDSSWQIRSTSGTSRAIRMLCWR